MLNRKLIRYLRREVLGETTAKRGPRRDRRRGPARDWRYLAWVRSLPSAASGMTGCQAAHTGLDGGMSQKASDYSCIPLTPAEHREYHRIGRLAFEVMYGINCETIVKRMNHLWFSSGGGAE